ncbi:hypothetical protein A9Q86_10620 [Flavobacteriales bacterium 33_180_T64]|nr:hypothetical protein A9Q86_10620 [Flavobacteriales bacterium 33_180_T64]
MKNLISCLILLISFIGFSQSKTEKEAFKITKIEAIGIEVTIDSVEELESVFKVEDVEELFSLSEADGTITFTLNCDFDASKNNLKGSMTYTVKGEVNEKAEFLKNIKKAKAIALKFYNFKNRI